MQRIKPAIEVSEDILSNELEAEGFQVGSMRIPPNILYYAIGRAFSIGSRKVSAIHDVVSQLVLCVMQSYSPQSCSKEEFRNAAIRYIYRRTFRELVYRLLVVDLMTCSDIAPEVKTQLRNVFVGDFSAEASLFTKIIRRKLEECLRIPVELN